MSKVSKKTITDIAWDIYERALSGKETYELVKNYYGIKIDFRTIEGKQFMKKLYKLVEEIEGGKHDD